MKEKDEHIEQLLKERELERSEVARAASQCDEVRSGRGLWRGNTDEVIRRQSSHVLIIPLVYPVMTLSTKVPVFYYVGREHVDGREIKTPGGYRRHGEYQSTPTG